MVTVTTGSIRDPADAWGEAVHAVAVARPGAAVNAETLIWDGKDQRVN
jgi:hypothetical protein